MRNPLKNVYDATSCCLMEEQFAPKTNKSDCCKLFILQNMQKCTKKNSRFWIMPEIANAATCRFHPLGLAVGVAGAVLRHQPGGVVGRRRPRGDGPDVGNARCEVGAGAGARACRRGSRAARAGRGQARARGACKPSLSPPPPHPPTARRGGRSGAADALFHGCLEGPIPRRAAFWTPVRNLAMTRPWLSPTLLVVQWRWLLGGGISFGCALR